MAAVLRTAALVLALERAGPDGLSFSAAVIEFANWRFLFWVGAVLALPVGVALACIAPRSPITTAARRFEGLGAAELADGLVSLLLAVLKGADRGWASPLTLGLAAVAVIVLLFWGWWELRTPSPSSTWATPRDRARS